jgi:hypothetical protein
LGCKVIAVEYQKMGSGLRFCDFHLVIFKRDYGASRIIDQHSATSLAENRRIAGLTPNSPVTGKIGPSAPLEKALIEAGIKIIRHK